MPPLPSIFDVAARAQVSKSTVSRVIRGVGRVAPPTRHRILAAIAELDYQPHYFGQCLRGQRTNTIGILIPNFSNPFYAEVFKGIEAVLSAHGLMTIICISGQSPQRELTAIKQLLGRKIDGVIYFTYNLSDPVLHCLEETARGGTPIVFMDPIPHNTQMASVVSNGLEGSRMAANHLLALGRRRIGYIKGPERHWVTRERFEGYTRALTEAGIVPRAELIYEGDFTLESGAAGASRLMNRADPPDAIMAATDVMAIGALRWLRQSGHRVPQAVAVVGFDNIDLAEWMEPGLTTVAQPIEKLGRQAAEMMVEACQDPDYTPRRIVMDCELVIRESTPRPAATAVQH